MKKLMLFFALLIPAHAFAWSQICVYGPHQFTPASSTLYQQVNLEAGETIFNNAIWQQNEEYMGATIVVSPWYVQGITFDLAGSQFEVIFLGGAGAGFWHLDARAYLVGAYTVPWPPFVVTTRSPATGWRQCSASGFVSF